MSPSSSFISFSIRYGLDISLLIVLDISMLEEVRRNDLNPWANLSKDRICLSHSAIIFLFILLMSIRLYLIETPSNISSLRKTPSIFSIYWRFLPLRHRISKYFLSLPKLSTIFLTHIQSWSFIICISQTKLISLSLRLPNSIIKILQ